MRVLPALALAIVVTLCGSASATAELRDHSGPVAGLSSQAIHDECIADLALSGDSKALIRYTISCAVGPTKLLATVEPGAGQQLIRVSRRIPASGPGAVGPARCELIGGEMTCRARRAGPVQFKGWLTVDAGTRCRDRFAISTGSSSHGVYPLGCPDARRPPLPSVAEIEQFRREHGLDLDLSADSAAITARAVALREALRDGDPSALVARRAWGVPLREVDLRELGYRLYYNLEGSTAMYEWFNQNARDTYAGSWIDETAGGVIYVRFTGDQDSQVAALRSAPGILAPERIVGYSVPALHSMAELGLLADLVVDEGWGPLGLRGLMTSVGIGLEENKVLVGACDPESVAAALVAHFGSEAPLSVVYQPPLERKSKKARTPKSAGTPRAAAEPLAIRKPHRRPCRRF